MEPKKKTLSTTSTRRGRPKKIERESGQLEWDFDKILTTVNQNEEAAGTLMAMLASRHQGGDQWRGLMAVPPASFIEAVISEFRQKTNLPLELPFFVTFAYVSGYLLRRGTHLMTEAGRVDPDIWLVLLASSGAGKTFVQKQVREALGDVVAEAEFPGTGIVSSARFVEKLSEHPRGVWVRDEFAQYLKAISADAGPLADMKDYLLRLYDNDSLERSSLKGTVKAENPALSILGLTVHETFSQHVTAEMMLDGFAQRFAYIIAQADPARHFTDYPIWKIDTSAWQRRWQEIEDNIRDVYYAPEATAGEAFRASFKALYNEGLPESFYRRILWRAHKYALIYHVLTGDPSEELTAVDYGWAARALSLHIDDAAKLIGDHGLGDLERLIQAGERVARRVMLEEKRPVKPRDLIRGISNIKNVTQAESLLRVMTMMRPSDDTSS